MQFGKPSKATYEFAEQVLRTQIELLYGSIKKLPNMCAIWNTIFTYTHCHFMVDTWLEVNLSKYYFTLISANSSLPIPSDNPESGMSLTSLYPIKY